MQEALDEETVMTKYARQMLFSEESKAIPFMEMVRV
jgi:hypothetical protein